jgi:hypothetical protein
MPGNVGEEQIVDSIIPTRDIPVTGDVRVILSVQRLPLYRWFLDSLRSSPLVGARTVKSLILLTLIVITLPTTAPLRRFASSCLRLQGGINFRPFFLGRIIGVPILIPIPPPVLGIS